MSAAFYARAPFIMHHSTTRSKLHHWRPRISTTRRSYVEGLQWLELQLQLWTNARNNQPCRKSLFGKAINADLQMTCDFTHHRAPTSSRYFAIKSSSVRAPQRRNLTITIRRNFGNAGAGQIGLLRRLRAPFLNVVVPP